MSAIREDPVLRYYDIMLEGRRAERGAPIPRQRLDEIAQAAGLITAQMTQEALDNWLNLGTLMYNAAGMW